MLEIKLNETPPILFLIFNRLDSTINVFNSIRNAKPKEFFIASDGPRLSVQNEKEIVEEIRTWVLKEIDWECNIHTLFRENNLGCGKSVSSSINWFFEHVPAGIIIEDDCIPHEDFYKYAAQLLIKYNNVPQIQFIGGSNFQNGIKRGKGSYYYSNYCHVWGWATWKRVWENYEFSLKSVTDEELLAVLNKRFSNKEIRDHWFDTFNEIRNEKIDTWDYQLVYAIWKASGLSVIPNINLVSNIGFGMEATHTKNKYSVYANKITKSILPLFAHDNEMVADDVADDYFFYNFIKRNFIKKIKNKILFFLHK